MSKEKKYFGELPVSFGKKWTAAMRDGSYTQIKGKLWRKNEDGGYAYCALGVACDVAGHKLNRIKKKDKLGTSNIQSVYKKPKVPCSLYQNNELQSHIAEMNDTGYTLPEIADWIDDNVKFV